MQLSRAQPLLAAARVTGPSTVAAAAVIGGALALIAGGIAASRGFDGLYGQDAYAYFDYSTQSVRESILHLRPLEAFFWPPGYPILVALTSLLTGQRPLAGQIVSLAMAATVPVCTAILASELFDHDKPLAILSAALVAVCGQLWQSGVVVMADTTGLALATFGAWCLVRYARTSAAQWLLAASAAIAFATLSRWIDGLVGISFGVYALMVARGRVGHAVLALAGAAVILLPVVGPPLVGLLTQPTQPAAFAGNFQVYSWSPLNAFRHDFFTADGHLEYTQPNGVYYAILPANLAFFGPLLAVWILPGLWSARHWPARTTVLIVGWAAIVFAFHAGAPWQNFRFALAYLPPLAILSAAGILFAWRALGKARYLVALCVALGILTTTAAAARLVERFIDAKDHELSLVHWVTSQTPANAQLFTFGPTLAFRHYSNLPTDDLFDLSPTDLNDILARPAPHYLLVDEASVESQWLDQPPSQNFHSLRDAAGLTELGESDGYTLYRVGSP